MAIFDTEKYFNAQEAFNRTCKVKNEIMNNSLNEIYNNINTSIKLGKTSVTIYEHYDDVINFSTFPLKLVENGFIARD